VIQVKSRGELLRGWHESSIDQVARLAARTSLTVATPQRQAWRTRTYVQYQPMPASPAKRLPIKCSIHPFATGLAEDFDVAGRNEPRHRGSTMSEAGTMLRRFGKNIDGAQGWAVRPVKCQHRTVRYDLCLAPPPAAAGRCTFGFLLSLALTAGLARGGG